MPLIDTHAHIYDQQFKEDSPKIIERAHEAGIQRIYMPNIDQTSIDAMLLLEDRYPGCCLPMMGLHPGSVNKHFEQELYLVESWLQRRPFVAVGEIGLDYYWDTTFQAQQQEAFRIQIDWARQYQIPVVIHTRSSFEDAIAIVEEKKDERLTGVFHCFTGTADEAKRIAEAGFYAGLGGVTTFKNAKMDEVIAGMDLDHIVLETDSPYLAPVPHRGKRNEPAYLPLIAQKVADCKQVSVEELAEKTTQNALTLFKSS